MTEPTEPTAPTTEPPTPDDPARETPPAKPEPDWKAEARKWEQRAKDNSAAAKKLAELDEANKTEAQKAADQLAAAQKEAADATARALRLEIAAEKGLTAAQAKRLVGTTREELEADADELLASFPATTAAKPTAPKPDPSQGPKNPAPQRARSLTEAIKAHYATGASGG